VTDASQRPSDTITDRDRRWLEIIRDVRYIIN
jgi:hypothetical protein